MGQHNGGITGIDLAVQSCVRFMPTRMQRRKEGGALTGVDGVRLGLRPALVHLHAETLAGEVHSGGGAGGACGAAAWVGD